MCARIQWTLPVGDWLLLASFSGQIHRKLSSFRVVRSFLNKHKPCQNIWLHTLSTPLHIYDVVLLLRQPLLGPYQRGFTEPLYAEVAKNTPGLQKSRFAPVALRNPTRETQSTPFWKLHSSKVIFSPSSIRSAGRSSFFSNPKRQLRNRIFLTWRRYHA